MRTVFTADVERRKGFQCITRIRRPRLDDEICQSDILALNVYQHPAIAGRRGLDQARGVDPVAGSHRPAGDPVFENAGGEKPPTVGIFRRHGHRSGLNEFHIADPALGANSTARIMDTDGDRAGRFDPVARFGGIDTEIQRRDRTHHTKDILDFHSSIV